MTYDERMKAFDMRIRGRGWGEIGKALGYSRTAVQEDLKNCVTGHRKPVPCVYPALRDLIITQYWGSIPLFAKACGASYDTMYACLTGRTSPKSVGPKICALTGLTPVEAFRKEDPNDPVSL